MTDKRVVITGIGVLASNGIGKGQFFNSLSEGVSGIKAVSLFDTSGFTVKDAGEIKDFSPEQFLGPKGLRVLDRSTKLINCAAKFALEDAGISINEDNACKVGVCLGNTLGSLHSVCDFDIEAIKEGPRYVNPALFPNTVVNSAASQVSIRFGIKGFNVTISTGFTASLDAIGYASEFLRQGRVDAVLAGAVEELCLPTFAGFYKIGLMNRLNIGEAAALIALEEVNSAINRKADIQSEVLGLGSGWGGKQGIKKAMRDSLDESGLSVGDIGFICSGANSGTKNDIAENQAIDELFPVHRGLKVSRIKHLVGECYSASGILQVAAGMLAVNKGLAENVLVNAFGPFGNNASLIISKYRG